MFGDTFSDFPPKRFSIFFFGDAMLYSVKKEINMSTLDTFDPESEEIVRAKDNVEKIDGFPKTVLVVFSKNSVNLLLEKFDAEKIGK